jgi:hypothetical protein
MACCALIRIMNPEKTLLLLPLLRVDRSRQLRQINIMIAKAGVNVLLLCHYNGIIRSSAE